MVQLLQEYVRRPERLVSLAGLLDNRIEAGAAGSQNRRRRHDGGGRRASGRGRAVSGDLGGAARTRRARRCAIRRRWAAISCSARAVPYFRDVGYAACNKRAPGSGCAAIGGENRWHAVLGTSENCIAAHASDLAVALVALDAAVEVLGPSGQRTVPLDDFYRLPGDTPHIETVLEPGEVIAAITVPASPVGAALALPQGARPRLLRVRARIGRGGARDGRRPHPAGARRARRRRNQAVARARGRGGLGRSEPRSGGAPRAAAALAAEGAQGRGHNDFKIELMQRAIVRAVETAGARA